MRKRLSFSFKFFCASLLTLFSFSLAQPNSSAGRDWQPRRTWVFVVGVLRWQHRDMFSSFPQANRRDAQLVEFFRQAGVPEQQIVFLKDEQATTRRVRNGFPAFLSQTAPGDFLFVYYTGHGYKSDDARRTFFATYDTSEQTDGWATDSIVRDIEANFKGSRALLTADTCYSGDLAWETQRLGRRVSYATLASTSSNRESTANWTFTEMLLAGLRGQSFADINGDGEVTLSELAEDIKEDMAFAEEQRSVFVVTGNFSAEMFVAPAAHRNNPAISQRVEVFSDGDWYKARVIDARGAQYRVHYFGYEDSDDEWVTARQMRANNRGDYVTARGNGEWGSTSPTSNQTVNHRKHEDAWDESIIEDRPQSNNRSNNHDWRD